MKNIKRLLIFIMAVALIFTMTPLAGTAALADDGDDGETIVEVQNWSDLCNKYGEVTDEEEGELTITIPSGTVIIPRSSVFDSGLSVMNYRKTTSSGASLNCKKFILTGGGTIRPQIPCDTGLLHMNYSNNKDITLTLRDITLDGTLDDSVCNTAINIDDSTSGNTVNIESGCTIKNFVQNSSLRGAAVNISSRYSSGTKNKLNIRGGLITQNTYNIAAIHTYGGTDVDISGGTFSNNTATSSTGAVCLVESNYDNARMPGVKVCNAVFHENKITKDGTVETGGDFRFDVNEGQIQLDGWSNNTFSHSDSTAEADKYKDVVLAYRFSGQINLSAALTENMYFTGTDTRTNLEGKTLFSGSGSYTMQQSDYDHLHMLEGSLNYKNNSIIYRLNYDAENHLVFISEFPSGWTTVEYTVTGLGGQTLEDAVFDVEDQTDPESESNATGRSFATIGVIPGHAYKVTVKSAGYKNGEDSFTAESTASTRTLTLEADPLNYTIGSWNALYDAFGDTDDESGLITIKIPKNTTVKVNGSIACPNAPVKFAGGTYQRADGFTNDMFVSNWVQPNTFKNVTFNGADVSTGNAVVQRQVYNGKTTPDDALTTFSGCTFANVNTTGSVVALQYPASKFQNCTFQNCTVVKGCLSTEAKFSVTGCTFDGINTPADATNPVSILNVNSEGNARQAQYIYPTSMTVSDNTYTDIGDAAQVCFSNKIARKQDYITYQLTDKFIPEISSTWGVDSIILDGYYSKIRLLDAITADHFKVKVINPSEQYKMIIGSNDYQLTQDDLNKIQYVPKDSDDHYTAHLSTDNNSIVLSEAGAEQCLLNLSIEGLGKEYNADTEHFTLTDSNGNSPTKQSDGVYLVEKGRTYTCKANIDNYAPKEQSVTVTEDGQLLKLKLTQKKDDKGRYHVADWAQLYSAFGSTDENGKITIHIPEGTTVEADGVLQVNSGSEFEFNGSGTLMQQRDLVNQTSTSPTMLSFIGKSGNRAHVVFDGITIDGNRGESSSDVGSTPISGQFTDIEFKRGTIRNIRATNMSWGGVISLNNSRFTMTGGTIENCYSMDTNTFISGNGNSFGSCRASFLGGTIKNTYVSSALTAMPTTFNGTKLDNVTDVDGGRVNLSTWGSNMTLGGDLSSLSFHPKGFNAASSRPAITLNAPITGDLEFVFTNSANMKNNTVLGGGTSGEGGYTVTQEDADKLVIPDDQKMYVKADTEKNQLILKKYNVATWDVNGELTKTKVAEDEHPVFDGSTGRLPDADDDNYYVFKGWSDGTDTYEAGTELPQITQDQTFTAQYETYPRKALNDNPDVTVTVDPIPDQVWDGNEQTPHPVVKYGDVTLTEGLDYTVAYQNNEEPGVATAVITGRDQYKGTLTVNFTITEKDKATFTIDEIKDVTWNGEAQTPDVTVRSGDQILKKGSDYTLTYQNNEDAGTAKVIVTGNGTSCKGVAVAKFNIQPCDISNTTIMAAARMNSADYLVYDGSSLLKKDKDYTIESSEISDDQTSATVTIKGQNNYTGTRTETISLQTSETIRSEAEAAIAAAQELNAADYTSASWDALQDALQNMWEKLDDTDATAAEILTAKNALTDAQNALQKRADTEARTKAAEELDTAAAQKPEADTSAADWQTLQDAIAKARSVVEDVDSTEADIAAALQSVKDAQNAISGKHSASLNNATVTVAPAVYNGSEQTANVTVKDAAGNTVAADQYTIFYGGNHTDAGNCPIVIFARSDGSYTGSIDAVLTIAKADLSDAKVSSIAPQVYTGKAIKPGLTVKADGRTLKKDVDYTVRFSSNVKEGTAKAVLTGIGNYQGTATATFRIVKRPAAPKKVKAVRSGSKKTRVTWKRVSGASGYMIYRAKNSGKYKAVKTVKSGKTVKYTSGSLSKGKYRYRIKSYKTVSGHRIYSGYSSMDSVTVR
ncbi:MAG: cell envelope integrity protein TolA [Anaerovoracaceae bacterium]|jgi:hypothetical protein